MDYTSNFYTTLFGNASQDLYPDNTIAAFTTKLAHPLDLGSGWEVGVCELSSPPSESSIYLKGNEVAAVGGDYGFLYCDFIAPQIVGDSFVRCLRTYPLSSGQSEQIFQSVYYVPVQRNTIHTIRIEALTQRGNRGRFINGYAPLRLVLHFRRVRV